MKKIIDVLLVLGLIAAIVFFVYVELNNRQDIQPTPVPVVTATNTVALGTSTVDPVTTADSPSASSAVSPLPPAPTFTPSSTASPRPTPTPPLMPTGTATLAGLATLVPVNEEIRQGIEQGNQIVQAIESYRQAQGSYPQTLGELAPSYLPAFPATGTGQPFFYRVFDGETAMSAEVYWVAFKVASQEHVTCTYLRRLQFWDCNFDSP